MKTHIIYLVIVLLLITGLGFVVHEWDSKNKQIENMQTQIQVSQTLDKLDSKVNDIVKREDMNKNLDQSIAKVNKKLDDLYKVQKSIPIPSRGVIENEVKTYDINAINSTLISMGYKSSIVNRGTGNLPTY